MEAGSSTLSYSTFMAIFCSGSMIADIILGATVLIFLVVLVKQTRRIPKGLRLPPGPRGKPIVGNMLQMPKHYEWVTYTRWAKEYGDLVYFNVLGKHMICVNSLEVAHDLFESRSSTADRPDFAMLNDLMGSSIDFAFMKYGGSSGWRQHRKLFHQHFNATASTLYHDVEIKHTQSLLKRLHKSPQEFVNHLRHLAGATIMEIVYGIRVLSTGDPYIAIAEKGLAAQAEAGNPGTFLVDTLPILKFVPEWMPGAGFRKKARLWRVTIREMFIRPFMTVKTDLNAGIARPSATASLLEELSLRGDASVNEEEVIRNSMGSAYSAGADITVAAMSCFMLAIVLYPETQKKAQIELDAVIGSERLPVFDDRKRLPYINALCKEVHRWHPVIPLGLAHRVMEDETYGNFFLPGGSTIFGNAWSILHDEKIYGPEPDRFEPERFLKPGVKDPTAAFGYGRRICPGRFMADDSLFIAAASILILFNLSPARDDAGNEIPIVPSFTSGLISHPEPFQCTIKLRSASAEALLADHGDDQNGR